MRHRALSLIAAGTLMAIVAPAHADVFSSQSFSGSGTTLNNLPGVNLDAGTGVAAGSNCVETPVNSYSWRDSPGIGTRTDCTVGNFTFSTVRDGNGPARPDDTTYGGNPPPWEQRWRP